MKDTVKEHNYSVDIIRFGLIAWIVLHHYTCVYNVIDGVEPIYFPLRFNQGGHVGNACFFVLAGYFMGRNFFKGSFSSIKEFILYCVRRYLRFYPTYALAVVFIAIWLFGFPLPERETDILKFVVNFLFIVHPSGFVDGAHWFVAILLLCQCITVILKFTPPIFVGFPFIFSSVFSRRLW